MALSPAAVFLDKDGTVVEDVPYNADPDRTRLTDGAAAALQRLHQARYELVIVSNQAGVAHGHFPEGALGAMEDRLRDLLWAAGVPLRGFLYCPHHPAGCVTEYRTACACRKPAPGLLLRAMSEYGLVAGSAWMVGDILDDVEAGRRAGCRTILIDNGSETEWQGGPYRQPDFTVSSLPEAAAVILARENRS